MRVGVSRVALALGLAASMWMWVDDSFARGFRGGGGGVRAGGMSSISRGSSGMSRGSSMGSRPRASTRPSGGAQSVRGDYGGGVNRANAGNRAGIDGNRQGRGDRIERGDNRIGNNVNIGNDININNDNGWGRWDDGVRHPVAAGMVVGATAAATAAALGSVYYSVPSGCTWGAYSYYWCDGYFLEPRYEGDTVVYVNVPDPRTSGGN